MERNPNAGALAAEVADAGCSSVRDFWTLLKPNVMQLVVFSAWAGLYLAPGTLHPVIGFTAILCVAIAAGGSAAINNWFDADIDARMSRTRRRPTASGRIDPADALALGITLTIMAVMIMGLAVNWTAAALLALTTGFYVFVYTIWLKRRTPQNIVIGGAAGAFPPMVGWAAATGDLSWAPLILFAIIFIWTPAHFWSLSLYRCGDYAAAGVPMLPVVAGHETTRRHVLGYTLALVPLTAAPWLLGFAGHLYLAAAAVLGAVWIVRAVQVVTQPGDVTARRSFRFSIVYLFGIFGALVADKALGFGGG